MANPSGNLNIYKTEQEALTHLAADGYTQSFSATKDGLTYAGYDGTIHPDQIKIKEVFRFEGMSDPDDTSVVYAIETSDGTKGTLVDAYGANADRELSEFIEQIPLEHGEIERH
jgi:hypothetical protein